jgi:hypothetical protein
MRACVMEAFHRWVEFFGRIPLIVRVGRRDGDEELAKRKAY